MYIVHRPTDVALDQGVSKPEGRGGEGVGNGRVDGLVVALVVAAGQQAQLKYLEHPAIKQAIHQPYGP